MAKTAVAFSPGHISGYFRRVEGASYEDTGSTGAGIVITEGVRTFAKEAPASRVEVHVLTQEGMHVEHGSPPLEHAMERLGLTAHLVTECRLPIGCGFGLSAAALLSSISALDALYSLHLSRREIARLAHEMELVHRTGLGDVAACMGGGLACRRGGGIQAEVERFFPEEAIHALALGPIFTPEILGSSERMAMVERAYPGRCPSCMEEFFSLSRDFAERSGLITPRVRRVLEACDTHRIPASMTMLGEGVFALGESAYDVLSAFGRCWRLGIAREGFTKGVVHDDP